MYTINAAQAVLVGWCVMTDQVCVQMLYHREGDGSRLDSLSISQVLLPVCDLVQVRPLTLLDSRAPSLPVASIVSGACRTVSDDDVVAHAGSQGITGSERGVSCDLLFHVE